MNAAHKHVDVSVPVAEKQRDAQKKGNVLAVAKGRTFMKDY